MDGSFNLYEVWLDYSCLGIYDTREEAERIARKIPNAIVREVWG